MYTTKQIKMTIGTKNQKELEKIKYDKNLNENTNHGDDSI